MTRFRSIVVPGAALRASIALAIAARGVALASSYAHADDPPRSDAPPPVPPPTSAPAKSPTGSFEIGAGYNSDEGFLATARVAQSALFGTGHGLALSASLSALRQDFALTYEVPRLGDGLDLRAELAARSHRHDGFVREGAGGTLELGKRLGRATRAYVRYRAEEVRVVPHFAQPLARTLVPDDLLGDGFHAALGLGIAYDTRDQRVLPTTGTRLELSAETASRDLASQYDYTKLAARADHARPLGPLTLRLSGRATAITSGAPLSERLFHDGHADIRGYRLGGLEPGFDRGANLEALGRVELELPVWKRAGLSLAAFADVGWRENTDAAWGPSAARCIAPSGCP